MKRLLALLLLAVMSPAFAQEQPPIVIYDPVVEQTYTLQQSPTTSLDNVNQTGTPLTLYDDGTTFTPIDLPFDFYYFGNLFESVYISQNGFISFTSNANGCCNGNVLPFLSQDPYYNMNNSIFAMWSDLADFNTPGNPYYQAFADRFTVGWYGVDELGTANKFTFEITLFDNSNFSITYGNFDYAGPSGRTFTSGFQGDTSNEFWQLYNGNDPTVLENNTYLFASSEITPPPPPPPPPPEEPIAPDCTVDPTNPTCIINDITNDEPILVADETTGSDDGSSDGTEVVEEEDLVVEEEMLADADLIDEELLDEEEMGEEESLEELLADEDEEEVATEERLVVYRELTDEEKAAILADTISKNTLEAALSVATDAVTSAATVSSTTEVLSSESSSRLSTLTDASSESITITETVVAMELSSETSKEESTESSALAALDILETGRQLGQGALAVTLAGADASAMESLNDAESIAAVSSSDSVLASMNSIETAAAVVIEEQQIADNETTMEATTEEFVTNDTEEIVVAENAVETNESTSAESVEQKEDIKEEVLVAIDTQTQQTIETSTEQKEEELVAEVVSETIVENVEQMVAEAQSDQPSAVEFTTVEQAMEVFVNNVNQQAAAEQEELENNIIQQAIASSQNNEEDNRMGFAEAEAVTIASDPALANAFNVQPNTANLELLGVLGSRAEEKSDAEVRAEQVVAANKEQQDAINANYMDADQSGIVAAIGAEADVSSYLSQRLQDVPFYKPEDIYKGIIIKDNVRGSYFLEKGNTDTYKKMVEEQYK